MDTQYNRIMYFEYGDNNNQIQMINDDEIVVLSMIYKECFIGD